MTSELIRGTAHGMGYQEFSQRIRRRVPMRWYVGKIKWWRLRLTNLRHPAFAGRASWLQAATRAANTAHLAALGWTIGLTMSAGGADHWSL